MNSKAIIPIAALITIFITASVVTAGLLSDQQTIRNGGTVSTTAGVDVFNDAQATSLCTYLDWGTLYPSDLGARTIYVKNTGNVTETLHLSTTEWSPTEAGNKLSLSWNKESTVLQPGQLVSATLTLRTPQDVGDLTDFAFNIVIEGTQSP